MGSEEYGKTRKKSRKARRRKARKVLLIIEIIVLIILLGFLYIMLKFGRIDFQDIGETTKNEVTKESQEVLKGYENIALFGVDNRSNGQYDGGNSDSIMIASINNDTKEVKIVSVYRDTCMDVDGEGKLRKCNYAYNHGGAKAAVNMLNRNLDMDISDYVAVDFYALAECVDAVGGLDLTISEKEASVMNKEYISYTSDIVGKKSKKVQAGESVHCDGIQTVSYCRVRYTASGDFGRAARQRIVLQKLIAKMKSANILELNNLIDSLFDDISTSLSVGEITSLASAVRDYTLAATYGYPYKKAGINPGKTYGDLVVPCTVEDNVKQLYSDLFGEQDHQASSTVKNISEKIETFTGLGADDANDYKAEYEDASGDAVVD